MGCDIYLRSLKDAAEKQWKPVFDAAVKKRDDYIAAHPGCDARTDPDDWTRYDNPKVQALQDAVNAAYNAMNGPDCYWRDSYNSSNLFAQIGLSWHDVPTTEEPRTYEWDGETETCDACVLDADGLRWLIAELKNRQI